LAKDEGISQATLTKRRAEARAKEQFLLDANAGPEGWNSHEKLSAVIVTESMNAADRGEYCRRRGVYPEQLSVWREACERANDWQRAATTRITRETKDDKKRIKKPERNLARNKKGLADAAPLNQNICRLHNF
jgi:hypothetical protein